MSVIPTPPTLTPAGTAIDDGEVARIRNDFPILAQQINDAGLVYLDSGATSQNPQSVIEAEQEFYEQRNAAVHRGAHSLAVAATDVYEEARHTVARFIGAGSDEVVWTANATEAINLLTYSFSNASAGRGSDQAGQFALKPGDEIVVTEMEHHANLIPWQELAFRTGATLRYIPVDDDGALLMEEAASIINPATKVVAFTHASNVLGSITPVEKLTSLAHTHGAFAVLDGCQSVPHLPVDVKTLDVDFLAFSGHKMLGPTGIGVLYGKAQLLNAMPPFLTGGSMITKVTMDAAEYLPAPMRFEAGTQQVSQVAALAVAVNYLQETGMERIAAWESALGRRLVEGLQRIDGVRVLGPEAGTGRIGLAAFEVEGVHAHDVGQFLDDQGIAVRVGHHCAQPLHRRLGLMASTRASTYLYNTTADVDYFLDAVTGIRPFFGATS